MARDLFDYDGDIYFSGQTLEGFEAVDGIQLNSNVGGDWDNIGRGEESIVAHAASMTPRGEPMDPELRKVMRAGLDQDGNDDDGDIVAETLDEDVRREMARAAGIKQ